MLCSLVEICVIILNDLLGILRQALTRLWRCMGGDVRGAGNAKKNPESFDSGIITDTKGASDLRVMFVYSRIPAILIIAQSTIFVKHFCRKSSNSRGTCRPPLRKRGGGEPSNIGKHFPTVHAQHRATCRPRPKADGDERPARVLRLRKLPRKAAGATERTEQGSRGRRTARAAKNRSPFSRKSEWDFRELLLDL